MISTREWRHTIFSLNKSNKPNQSHINSEWKLRPTKSIGKLLERLQLFFYQLLRSVLFFCCVCARAREFYVITIENGSDIWITQKWASQNKHQLQKKKLRKKGKKEKEEEEGVEGKTIHNFICSLAVYRYFVQLNEPKRASVRFRGVMVARATLPALLR